MVLKNVLSFDRYVNFLALHVGITILCSKNNIGNISFESTEQILKYFVETFMTLYGKKYVSHDIHNLLHLTDDAKNFGILDDFSAFPFKNYMQVIKRMVRKQHQPLQQIINRKGEMSHLMKAQEQSGPNNFPILKKGNFMEGNIPNNLKPSSGIKHFKEIQLSNYNLKVKEPDNCVCLKDGTILCAKNFIEWDKTLYIVGEAFLTKSDFFEKPCKSSALGIYLIEKKFGSLQMWQLNQLLQKCVKLSYMEKFVIFPLLHV